jgi:ubiquinone/menaquinone biosynthesis C-methylase UbiE
MLGSRLQSAIGEQLRKPSGRVGGVIGPLMGVANRQSNRIAIDALKIASKDTILELGVGPGRAISALAAMAQHGRVFGIDHSVTMLAQAARRNRRAINSGRIHLLRGRFAALPFEAESIDKILAVHVAYFVGVDAAEILEARRVLRPGGKIAVFVTEMSAMERWRFTRFGSHRLYDRDEMGQLLSAGGFKTNEIVISQIRMPFGVAGLLAIATKAHCGRSS